MGDSPQKGYAIFQTSTWRCVIKDGIGPELNIGGGTPVVGRKTQLVMVLDRAANLLKLYVDGREVASASAAAVGSLSNTGSYDVGCFNNGTSNFHGGRIDRNRVWPGRALTAAEVLALYNHGKGLAFGDLGRTPSQAPSRDAAPIRLYEWYESRPAPSSRAASWSTASKNSSLER